MSNTPKLGFRGSSNLFVQLASVLVAGVALVAAVLMGAVLLAVILGLAVLGAAFLVVRIWWLRRKRRARSGSGGGTPGGREASQGGRLIDAEYQVLDERDPPAPGRSANDARDGGRR